MGFSRISTMFSIILISTGPVKKSKLNFRRPSNLRILSYYPIDSCIRIGPYPQLNPYQLGPYLQLAPSPLSKRRNPNRNLSCSRVEIGQQNENMMNFMWVHHPK